MEHRFPTFRSAVLPLIGGLWATALFALPALAEDIAVKDGVIDVQWTKSPAPAQAALARKWIRNSAKAVATYYGTFPVRKLILRITPTDGREPSDGVTSGWNGALITIGLGRNATEADLTDDWVLPHEMLHLAFPNVADRHHWIEEGLATYIEPKARARVGLLTTEGAWNDLFDGLPKGLPEAGDRGLDHTHTWARTYWGGALFCFRADLAIRQRTGNRLGLEHALRAILAAGGNIESSWDMDRVISVGDGATGVPVLRELYDEMKATPVRVDLSVLWKQLGIVRQGETVTFDDKAPQAQIRKSIAGG